MSTRSPSHVPWPFSSAVRFGTLVWIGGLTFLSLAVGCDGTPTESGTENPLPIVLGATPPSITVGDPPPLVTVRGRRFVPTSQARIDGGDRITTFIDDSTLSVQIVPDDIDAAATLSLAVVNPPPGGGTSGMVSIAVGYPTPVVAELTPGAALVGDAPPLMVITGSGFLPVSEVFVANFLTPSTYVSGTEIRVQLPAGLMEAAFAYEVVVHNPFPGGSSAARTFAVSNQVPTATTLSPDSALRDAGALSVAITGARFVNGSVVQVDGIARTTTFVSTTVLRVALIDADLATVRSANIRVVNPAPGGGASGNLPFRVVVPPPVVTQLLPAAATAGDASFTLVVRGRDFDADAVIDIGGVARLTTFISSGEVRTTVAGADVSSAGALQVVVRNPARGTGSPAAALPVLPPSPTIGTPLVVDLPNNHVIADPGRGVLYATIPSSVALIGNTVTKLDPLTGAQIASVAVGSEPVRMAITDDGQYLYVTLDGAMSVTRVRLSDFQRDIDIPLPDAGFLGQTRAEEVETIPGSPILVAVSIRNICCSPRHQGVHLFSNATRLPAATQDHTGSNRITGSSDPGVLYGYNNETSEAGFRRISVRADGLREEKVVFGGLGNDLEFSGGRVYSTAGTVMDVSTMTAVGTIGTSGPVRPDAALGRVHYLTDGELRTFHYTAFTAVGSAPLTEASGLNTVIRWGTDGLAFGGGGRIVIVRGSLIGQ